ncbi:MAG: ABC transporter ATP-binding protein [Planctomycetota bacterium]
MAEPRIVFSNVTKSFRMRNRSDALRDATHRLLLRCLGQKREAPPRFVALDDVSFQVAPGEVLGIIGHNGAGKSTSLRLAADVYPPDSGGITIRGRVSAFIELSAGFHPDLSGRENIFLGGALLGLSKREIRGVFDEIAEFADIGEFLESPVRTYSSGMAVRLGFAVAAHVPAEILLVDEVLAVGDQEFRAKCMDRMLEVKDGGASVIFVSHNLRAVEAFCDRVILLDGGKVRVEGTPAEALAGYEAAKAAPEYLR